MYKTFTIHFAYGDYYKVVKLIRSALKTLPVEIWHYAAFDFATFVLKWTAPAPHNTIENHWVTVEEALDDIGFNVDIANVLCITKLEESE